MQHAGYLQRRTITDPGQRIIGYEFLIKGAPAGAAPVVLSVLAGHGPATPLGKKLLFVEASPDCLSHPGLEPMPMLNVVLQVPQRLLADAALLHRCRTLKAQGYQLAIADFDPRGADLATLRAANFVGIDVSRASAAEVDAACRLLDRPGAQLLATGVETAALYQCGRMAGMARFSGEYFLRPTYETQRHVTASQAHIVDLLDKVQKGANDGELENLFKRDAALSFKVLKYINSAGFGLSCEIESIRHAIQILGRNELYRWLTLLLVTTGTSAPPALTAAAIVRGRFCELLGRAISLPRQVIDSLFIVGVFSLLDAMLEEPMAQALENLVLAEPINDALLDGTGMYAPFLQLVTACEAGPADPADLAVALGLSAPQVNEAMLGALAWAENFVQ